MTSIKGQEGIQQLVGAEQEAQRIITNARNLKMQRLKQAKEEADREIASYRSQLEQEYKKQVSDSSGQSGSTVKGLGEETEMKIRNLTDSASKVTPDVVALLYKYVASVRV